MNETFEKYADTLGLVKTAFVVSQEMQGGILERGFAAALDTFVKLPCVETALNFMEEFPELPGMMIVASDLQSYARVSNAEVRVFPNFAHTTINRLKILNEMNSFVRENIISGNSQIGFHRMRSQDILMSRLHRCGVKQWLVLNRRQWLRDSIVMDPRAFRAVVDLVCIHGIFEGKELMWNAIGLKESAQFYLSSEVLLDLGRATEQFVKQFSVDI
ncbi:MAG: hypothetical protein OXG24_04245 [Gammaproteobacteria bacterium]|nr:hypothetical protein [Gammaproteobacteria bacterium]